MKEYARVQWPGNPSSQCAGAAAAARVFFFDAAARRYTSRMPVSERCACVDAVSMCMSIPFAESELLMSFLGR